MSNVLKLVFFSAMFCSVNLFSMCMGCKKSGTVEFKLCASCMSVSYCSKRCQVSHWKEHKSTCGKVRTFKNEHKNSRDEQARLKSIIRLSELNFERTTREYKTLIVVRELEKAQNFLDHSQEDVAQAILLKLLNSKNEDSIRASIAYILARVGLYRMKNVGTHADFYTNVVQYLEKAVQLGHKSAQAMLVLFTNAAEGYEDNNDNSKKKDLENYIDDSDVGLRIQGRLAHEYYIESNPRLADEIFDKLLKEEDNFAKLEGAIGKLKYLVKTSKDKAAIDSAISLAKALYEIHPDKRWINDLHKYEFAVILNENGDHEQLSLSQAIFRALIEEDYRPAMYYMEEFQRDLQKEEEEVGLALLQTQIQYAVNMPQHLNNLVSLTVISDSSITQRPASAAKTAEPEMKTFAPVPLPVSLVREENPIIMALMTQFIALSPEATRDIKKLIKKHGALPFEASEITDVAHEIIVSKGQCNPNLASKIRGTKTFWRSWLARDYRMDWSYAKDTSGRQKIEIRHIAPKKNFTYRF